MIDILISKLQYIFLHYFVHKLIELINFGKINILLSLNSNLVIKTVNK